MTSISRIHWHSAALYCGVLCATAGCHRPGEEGGAAGGARRGGGPAVPVIAVKVVEKDTPIYFDGIGTVQAYNSVTIHTQVDGVLEKVAFEEGQDVNAGDLLATIDPRSYQAQLDQAKAKKAADEVQLASARVIYLRNHTLLSKGLIDQQTVDTQKATVDQLNASVQADAAAVEQQAVQLGYTQIKAPISGRTGVRLVDSGNVVHSSDPTGLVVITQLKPVSVVFTLPQQDWPLLQPRLVGRARLKVLAMGQGGGEPLDVGELRVVDNQIDATTGTLKLKAAFQNAQLILWPGQFVNVRLLVQTRTRGIVVPASVIQRGPQGAYAFVIKRDSTVEARPVQVAQIDEGMALIDQGLNPGEEVVVDGQYKLQVGSLVKIAPVAAPGGKSGSPAPPASS